MWSDSHPSNWSLCIPSSSLSLISPSLPHTSGSCKLLPVTSSDSVEVKNEAEVLSSCSSLFLSNFSACRKLISLLCRNLLFKQKDVSSAILHFSLIVSLSYRCKWFVCQGKGTDSVPGILCSSSCTPLCPLCSCGNPYKLENLTRWVQVNPCQGDVVEDLDHAVIIPYIIMLW